MIQVPNGAVVSVAASYSALLATTVATNALPCVMTSATHSYVLGDFVEINAPGWPRVHSKLFRIGAVTATTFELEGLDTTSTATYPAAQGLGFVRKVMTWTQLAQIMNSDSQGGDQQFVDYQFLESDSMRRIPTVKSSMGWNLTVADDATMPGFVLCSAASDDRLPRGVRLVLANASKLLYNCYVSVNKQPNMNVNQLMQSVVTLSFLAEPVRYAT